ncbi:MAG: daunorubicin resistance protein DrrA family ABC transporter ATP-binding protein [Candidatus Nitrosocaldaceae archaeon]|nr:MAG: daunorubicin resistance protein DrrA family ABC transporter ATP-binding protein [Candidatus Nitrosocaldaceae archaeon]
MSCISVNSLTKYYGSFKALDGISFDVEYNTVFGFLGPNGAGKTTTIKILTTLIKPSSGSATILGYDLLKDSSIIRSKIGIVQQKPSLENNLTVRRSLDIYGMLWGVPKHVRSDRIEHLLDVFGLDEVSNTRTDELSIGQKRRLQVAREFMHDMELLFLDEPTVGMDPSARRGLLDYIKKRVRDGLTVFYTTHIMEEAEYLCDKIAIINKGRLIALDSPQTLKNRYGGVKKVEIKLREPLDGMANIFNNVEVYDNTIRIVSDNAEEILGELIQKLYTNNIHIESLEVMPPTLEEIFLSMIER